jgi:hypothetical protein
MGLSEPPELGAEVVKVAIGQWLLLKLGNDRQKVSKRADRWKWHCVGRANQPAQGAQQ